MKINKNSMVYHLVLLSISNIILQILGTIYRIIIVRLVGAEGMGVYQLVFPYYTVIFAICISGLSVAVSRISAEKHALGDKVLIRRLVRSAIGIFVVSIAFVSIFTILNLDLIAGSILGDLRTKSAISVMLVCLFFTGFENIYKAYFYGIKSVCQPIASDLLEQIVRIFAVTGLLYFLRPKDGGICAALIICGMIISEVISSFCMKVFYERTISAPMHRNSQAKGIIKSIIAIAFPISFGGLINNLLGAANTVLIPKRLVVSGLAHQHALEDLGILFGMVIPLLMLPGVFISSLSTIIMPTLSRAMALNDRLDIRRKIAKAYRTTGIISFPSMAIMIALGEEICYMLYGQSNTLTYIIPLAVATIFVYFQIISASILNGLGMQQFATLDVIITGLIQLIFTYYLTGDPRFGIYGYITGYLISDALLMFLHMYFVLQKARVHMHWGSWFVLPAISAAFVGIITRMAFVFMTDYGIKQPIALSGAVIIGVCVYYILLKVEGIKIRRYIKSMIKNY